MTDKVEVRRFSLKRREIPIELELPNGDVISALLVEMSGYERDDYLNFMSKRIKVVGGKVDSIENMDGIQAELVHRCLVDAVTGKRIDKSEIQRWRAVVVEELFNLAQDLNGLGAKAEEDAKNV